MDIVKIAGIAVVAAILAGLLKNLKVNFSGYIAVIFGISVLVLTLGYIEYILKATNEITKIYSGNEKVFTLFVKILGIAYVSETARQLCEDAGEPTIGQKLEFAARALIIFLVVPQIITMVEQCLKLLS